MFPLPKKKKSAVKIPMRIFRTIVGEDPDANDVAVLAKQVAKERVVLKRPKYAKPDPLATSVHRGVSTRWEVLDVRNQTTLPKTTRNDTSVLTSSAPTPPSVVASVTQ